MSESLTFGGWSKPQKYGLGPLSYAATAVVFLGFIVTLLTLMIGNLSSALIVAAIFAFITAFTGISDSFHETAAIKAGRRVKYLLANISKTNTYRSGPMSKTKVFKLPGVASQITPLVGVDPVGDEFVILKQNKNTISIPLLSYPDGAALVSQEQINNWISQWGHFLGDMSNQEQLKFAQVIIETIPDNGNSLREQTHANKSNNSGTVSTSVIETMIHPINASTITTRTWIVLTYSTKLKDKALLNDMAARLPEIISSLAGTGAGDVHAATLKEIMMEVRTSYDPAAQDAIDTMSAFDTELEMSWAEIGPVAADARWTMYYHDSAKSKSWIALPPKGNIHASAINPILSSHPEVMRKRVALLYRPVPAKDSGRIIDDDIRDASIRSENKRGQARNKKMWEDANRRAIEEAQGASLTLFSTVITATVNQDVDEKQLDSVISGLAARSRLRVRPAYASHDSMFIQTLPLGVDVSLKSKINAFVENR